MHLLPVQSRSLDDEAAAVDLDLSPAAMLFLSFTDADLGLAAVAWEQNREALPGLRLIPLARLKHPFSVDLFVEKLASKARIVLVRLLGGTDYWRYGVDELAAAARRHGSRLAVIPGCTAEDPRLAEASTVSAETLATLRDCFLFGGAENLGRALRLAASSDPTAVADHQPQPVPNAGVHDASCRDAADGAAHALIVFYRSALLSADFTPVTALADALAARGARVTALYVTSLKDPASATTLTRWIADQRPDVILNTTAFSARDEAGGVLDRADCPVLQAIMAGSSRADWDGSPRGLRAADLAMNVVLPEVDGRIGAGVISFKAEADRRADLEFTRVIHQPDTERIAAVADLALAWAALRAVPRSDRRLACILSDYPGKTGRAGYAVGLDTPASVVTIADHLREQGFAVGTLPPVSELMTRLTEGVAAPVLSLADYRSDFANSPPLFRASVEAAWGDPADDPAVLDDAFRFRFVRAGALVVAVQPDRGAVANRRADYHDAALPPRHAYVAFYVWLRQHERCHALIHLGTHGTLEWLPGKAVALSDACAPAVLTGPLPVVYPFIVNNPGEAAQAKRRIGAVTLGHLTPPLVEAGLHGELAEIERMFDEYAEALTLDKRRAAYLGRTILAEVAGNVLLPGSMFEVETPEQALADLDAWLCDLKEQRIADGLHVYGRSPEGDQRITTAQTTDAPTAALDACGPAELDSLLRALDGRFVPPGPAGAPARGRLDVLPTGRNLYAVDPRAVPTRTAWTLGNQLATELVTRYAQDHGDWPRRVVLDLWGSATMRTGGDDLAQAFALIGARPQWDHASTRVNGFEILPLATLGRARVDVTLRISGLFRDTFPEQIALFDAAARAIALLDEDNAENPLAEAHRAGSAPARVFGAAAGSYGIGLARTLTEDPDTQRAALGEAYLAASAHGFNGRGEAIEGAGVFRDRVADADAFSHTGDVPGQDLLDSDTTAEYIGGFAAAATLLGASPALYHADTTRPDKPALRTLEDEICRTIAARASNPRWIAGQMRHGHRGAIALGETLDALYAFAATTTAVPSKHFDRYFDATLGDETVRAFLKRENAAVARTMRDKFEAALRRGFWTSRRNSTLAILRDEESVVGQPAGRAAR